MAKTTRTYVGHKELDRGRRAMEGEGWRVLSIDEVKQPPGAARIVSTGLVGALVIKPKAHFYVTFEKADSSPEESSRAYAVRLIACKDSVAIERSLVLLNLATESRAAEVLAALPAVVLANVDLPRAQALVRVLIKEGAEAVVVYEGDNSEALENAASVESETTLASELERLSALHAQGSLTDEEFSLAKQRALGVTFREQF